MWNDDPQEQENHNLMELFRVSKSEVEEQKQKLQKAEGLNSSIRHELLTLDSECRHLRETVSKQAKEMKQVRPSVLTRKLMSCELVSISGPATNNMDMSFEAHAGPAGL